MKRFAQWQILVVSLLVVAVACAGPTPTPTPAPKPTVAPAAAPKPTAAPAASTAATPAPAPKPTAPAAASPAAAADRLQQLYEAAKKEGTVVWNLAGSVGWDPAVAAFPRKFPGIKVEPANIVSAQLAPQIISETSANKLSIDVSNATISSFVPLIDRNLLVRFDWTGLNVAKERIILDGRGVMAATIANVIFYNKRLVPEAEVPRTWEDLLNPRWKGKIAMWERVPDLAVLPVAWGEQRAMEYVQKLKGQEVIALPRVAAVVDAVSRGEAAIGGATSVNVYEVMQQGAPLDVAPITPQFAFGTVIVAFPGSPHPNAAALLMAWVASDDGEQAFAAGGRLIFTPKVMATHPQGKLVGDKGIQYIFEDTIEKSVRTSQLREEYAKVLGFTPR